MFANNLLVCLHILKIYRFFVGLPYLHPGLTETKFLTEFLPHEGVWVVSLVKQTLQGTQLIKAAREELKSLEWRTPNT